MLPVFLVLTLQAPTTISIGAFQTTSFYAIGNYLYVPLVDPTQFTATYNGVEVFGSTAYNAINVTASTNIYITNNNNERRDFIYDRFSYTGKQCDAIDIYANPPSWYIFTLGDSPSFNTTLKHNMNLCFWFAWSSEYTYTYSFFKENLMAYNNFSARYSNYIWTLTEDEEDLRPYSVTYITFATGNRDLGGAAGFVVTPNSRVTNTIHITPTSTFCSRLRPCSWKSIKDYIDDQTVETPTSSSSEAPESSSPSETSETSSSSDVTESSSTSEISSSSSSTESSTETQESSSSSSETSESSTSSEMNEPSSSSEISSEVPESSSSYESTSSSSSEVLEPSSSSYTHESTTSSFSEVYGSSSSSDVSTSSSSSEESTNIPPTQPNNPGNNIDVEYGDLKVKASLGTAEIIAIAVSVGVVFICIVILTIVKCCKS